ncbi:hypothetical protein [Enterococcus faecalis]|nr:hypothetical protein [Enterococcus faecalis]MDT2096116.1 hypothetical protein [Enterococcus faecalis]
MKTINLIKVFIASPGDIAAKRNEVEETIVLQSFPGPVFTL